MYGKLVVDQRKIYYLKGISLGWGKIKVSLWAKNRCRLILRIKSELLKLRIVLVNISPSSDNLQAKIKIIFKNLLFYWCQFRNFDIIVCTYYCFILWFLNSWCNCRMATSPFILNSQIFWVFLIIQLSGKSQSLKNILNTKPELIEYFSHWNLVKQSIAIIQHLLKYIEYFFLRWKSNLSYAIFISFFNKGLKFFSYPFNNTNKFLPLALNKERLAW